MEPTATYRADIDGLRAVAVLLVVLYHFGIGPSGGFIGVDVFFVISGYLITQILHREIAAGQFSLLKFYERRIRRIIPALLVVVAATLASGWFLMVPSDYASLGWQAATASVGLSNFYFLFNSGYFDQPSSQLPLLHTWSLAVEEQYYLVWPLLLAAAWRTSNGSQQVVVFILSAIITTSFVISVMEVGRDPQTAFYMLHARAWEIALGALVVFLPAINHRAIAEAMTAIGLALIAVAGLVITAGDPFPGLLAAVPCIGAALIVWRKNASGAAIWLLSVKPVVFVGLISYSLYLWHWPVLVLFEHYSGERVSLTEAAGLLIISFALAILSWRYVERPFRRKPVARSIVASTSGIAACAIIFALAIALTDGVRWRLSSELQAFATYTNWAGPEGEYRTCSLDPVEDGASGCTPSDGKRSVLLLGDSHAGHFSRALPEAFPNVTFVGVAPSGCRPVLYPQIKDNAKGRACRDAVVKTLNEIIPQREFDAVILSARWANGQADQITETVEHISHYTPRVIVFGQTVEYTRSVPEILSGSSLVRRYTDPQSLVLYDSMKEIDNEMARELANTSAQYFSVIDALCPTGESSCPSVVNGIPVHRDQAHFTDEGARQVVAAFKSAGLDFW